MALWGCLVYKPYLSSASSSWLRPFCLAYPDEWALCGCTSLLLMTLSTCVYVYVHTCYNVFMLHYLGNYTPIRLPQLLDATKERLAGSSDPRMLSSFGCRCAHNRFDQNFMRDNILSRTWSAGWVDFGPMNGLFGTENKTRKNQELCYLWMRIYEASPSSGFFIHSTACWQRTGAEITTSHTYRRKVGERLDPQRLRWSVLA